MDRDDVQAVLARLEIVVESGGVLGVWPARAGRGLEIHLSPAAFWRTVKRFGPLVSTNEHGELLLPYVHRFTLEGIEFVTFSAMPVLPPGTLTPGYALRLT
jgi:hypothetical protein